jgi:hypothetical protein
MTEETEKHPGGAPTKYREDYTRMAYIACSEGGFTDKKLADLFGVSESTINRWKHDHPDFWDSIKAGKNKFDTEVVEKAFLKRCTGFYYNETTREPVTVDEIDPTTCDLVKVTKMVVTKRVRKYVSPDVKGCMDWLTNRAPDRWKKVKHVEIAGEDGDPVKTESMVAVPSGPMTIAEWEKQVKEARKADPELEPCHIPGTKSIPGNA